MNFELADLRAFIAVADMRSFVRAAKSLNLSQPALSRRIQKLEHNLGVPLLERSTRNVTLTMVGREGLEAVERGDADFGVNFFATSHPDIDFTPLSQDPFVLACRHDHHWRSERG